ncbi:MAG: hypothetical protein U9R16_05715 [Campylobacterota bacterium]|nr:hypothetical protein [Campylobacterota bacterium]
MNKKTKYLFGFMVVILTTFSGVIILLNSASTQQNKIKYKKDIFVQTVGLPDLAISTEANYIRHRSLSDIYSVFQYGPEHTEFTPSSFSIYLGKINYDNK